MNYDNFSKGSEWRKWDLHVHTPFSIVNYYYGNSDDEKWENFISDLEKLPTEFKVIGINDYIFIDGYKKVLDFKKNDRLKNIDLILPVIEVRIEKFAGHKDFKKVNFHIIFSNDLKLETIEQQFLNSLTSKCKLSPGTNGITWSGIITKDSIKELGRKIKQSVPKDKLDDYGTDLEEGFNNLCIDEKDIIQILETNSFLKGKYFTAIGKTEWESLSWNDRSIAIKKDIINKVDIVFISAQNIENFNNAHNKLKEQNVNDLLLDCSDAHYNLNSKNKDRVGKCFTWIKADPTFEGLKQIIYEPEERVFIGDEPELLKRAKENTTKFIKSIKINQIQGYSEDKGIWFKDIEIHLNPGFVAIIGNKGSGKSALTDIISLCGNSHNYNDFSFLNYNRFLQGGLAENFEAELIWKSGESIKKQLNNPVDKNLPERVKYIPQSYFEKLTNNLDTGDFEKTLENVVFSYIPEEKRLEKNNFSELIEYKRQLYDKEFKSQKEKIEELNKKIIELEKKTHPDYKKQIEEKLKLKEKELKEIEKNKPQEVRDPRKDENITEEQKAKQEELSSLNQQLTDLKDEITKVRNEFKDTNSSLEELKQIEKQLESFRDKLNTYIANNKERFSKYGLNIDEVIKFEINEGIIDSKIKEYQDKQRELSYKLSTEDNSQSINKDEKDKIVQKSLILQENKLKNEIKKIEEHLSEPQKKYQKYLEEYQKWNERKREIEGDEDKQDTIKWYKKEVQYLEEEIKDELNNLREERLSQSAELFQKKREILSIYKEFKEVVDKEIQRFQNILGEYSVSIEASFKFNLNFSDEFLKFINQRVKGTFYGIDEGKAVLDKLIKKYDINTDDGIKQFLSEIIEYLEKDKRENFNDEERNIKDQILNETKWLDFYNYIFSLNYIDISYKLKLGGKDLTQLSPGERGALLIVFYLLLDKENIPLIIDQPEENLDNESVFKIITHFVKYAKKRRQVIIVTHNPNIAIVGDADQIIYVYIDKANKNKFTFESGAIENPIINKHCSDILEGTFKAFDTRRLKYFKIEK